MIPKSMRSKSELAGVWFARVILKCVYTRKAIRTKFQKVDFFDADIMGKTETGKTIYIQVTTGDYEAIRQRKRKLEKYKWNECEEVYLLNVISRAEGRRTIYSFVINQLKMVMFPASGDSLMWSEINTMEIPKEWFKGYKE